MIAIFEQISIFDFLDTDKPKSFSWDDDINEILEKLKQFANTYNLEISKQEWKIWEHVPQFGYRMSVGLEVTRSIVERDDFWDGINAIIDYAKSLKIELSPFQPYFFGGQSTTTMSIFTTFLDAERRKRKEW